MLSFPLSSLFIPHIWGWPVWESSLCMGGEWPAVTWAPELLEMAAFSANTWAVQRNKGVDGRGQQPGSGSWS